MSINAKIDEVTYSNIETINAMGNVITLEEIVEETDGGIDTPVQVTTWDNYTEKSFGTIVKNMRNAKATGTFVYQALSTDFIQLFDTGLGDNWKGIALIDEDGFLPSGETYSSCYNKWFMYIDHDGYLMNLTLGTTNGSQTVSEQKDYETGTCNAKIIDGVFYGSSTYANQNKYAGYYQDHTYRWYAW